MISFVKAYFDFFIFLKGSITFGTLWIYYLDNWKCLTYMENKNRNFLIVFVIFICLHIILMLNMRLFPFVDVPHHLASAEILRDYDSFADYFSLEIFLKPNLFHFLFCGLHIFPSVEIANKIYFCLYIILFSFSIYLAIKKLGGNPWFSILAFVVIYNISVCAGFVGFFMAIPFVLIVFYFRIDEDFTVWKKIAVALFLVLLYFVHALAALFAIFLYVSLSIYQNRKSLRNLFPDMLVVIPVLWLIQNWWFSDASESEQSILSFLVDHYRTEFINTYLQRIQIFYFDNSHLFEGSLGIFIGLFFSLVIIIPVIVYLIKKKDIIKTEKIIPVLIFVFCSLFCYLFLPTRLPGFFILYHRFSTFILISMIILGSLLCQKPNKKLIILILSVSLFHLILSTSYFYNFHKENKGFTKDFLPDSSTGARVAGLIYDYKYRGRPVYIHYPNYYIIWKKGIAATTLAEYRFYPVIRRKVGPEKLPFYDEWAPGENRYDGRYRDMEYILVRGTIPEKDKKYFTNFEKIRSVPNWSLYEKM